MDVIGSVFLSAAEAFVIILVGGVRGVIPEKQKY